MYSSLVTPVAATLTLAGHIALVLFAIGLLLKIPFVLAVRSFMGKQAILLSFLVTLAALVGSLLYSEVLGFDPCVLCWVQRIFIYPQVLIAGLALYWKDNSVLKYLVSLSVLGGIVALYHSYTNLGGASFLPCAAEGGSCATLYVFEYGYITIPMMALTTFVFLIVFALCRKYEDR